MLKKKKLGNRGRYPRFFNSQFVVLFTFLFITGCSQGIALLKQPETKVAVLPFSGRGPKISQNMGHIAADKFTMFLFSKRGIHVVDRSQVNQVLYSQNINNLYYLSREDLRVISDSLGAAVVVMGLIENEINTQDIIKENNSIAITVRFLDGKTGEVLSIEYQKQEGTESPVVLITHILANIAYRI